MATKYRHIAAFATSVNTIYGKRFNKDRQLQKLCVHEYGQLKSRYIHKSSPACRGHHKSTSKLLHRFSLFLLNASVIIIFPRRPTQSFFMCLSQLRHNVPNVVHTHFYVQSFLYPNALRQVTTLYRAVLFISI